MVSFEEAIFNSLPPDNGLYYPENIPLLDPAFIKELRSKSQSEIGLEISRHFMANELSELDLRRIVEETLSFDFPLVRIIGEIHCLELFHGPTWAFKDLGARFLSRCMQHLISKKEKNINVLVATSGDTGGAVAAGFHGVDGVNVTILFPRNKVSDLQRKQLTTWGENVMTLEVEGSFDDCQRLVKTAFLDKDLNEELSLSSANSINIARLIPQMFYYFFAFQQLQNWDNVIVSVPSGNYGNLCAGLFAKKMGLPIARFIAASNDNKAVPDYLTTGHYKPLPSIETYANAMDVGAPSNFARLLEFFEGNVQRMRSLISGFSLSDPEILKTIDHLYQKTEYILDPHGAIGFRALQETLDDGELGIFLETAHPVKFVDTVKKAIPNMPSYQSKTEEIERKKSTCMRISSSYEDFRSYLTRQAV